MSMFQVPPNFFGGFDFFRWFRTTANMWHLGPKSGRLVGGSALKPGLPPAGADCRFSGRTSAGNPLHNARSGRPQTRRRKLRGPPPCDSVTRSRNPDFPNNLPGNRRFPNRPEIGRFVGGATLKCGPPSAGAAGRFPGPVFAGNPL